MNIAHPLIRRAVPIVAGAATLLLTACSEPEIVLPGLREDIRPEGAAPTQIAITARETRAIRLPSATSNSSWPQAFGTPAFRTAHPALRTTPQRVWSVGIGAGDSRRQRITASPIVGGGLIYTLDAAARVSAVTPSGAVRWSADVTPSRSNEGDATGGGLAYDNGTVYVSLGFGDLVALDATSGAVRWRQRLDATGSGMPTVSDGIVYVVAGDETGWAIDAATGRVRWQVDATPSIANVLGAPAPAITARLAVFAFGSGEVVATFKSGGVQRWTATVSGQREGVALARYSDLTGMPVVVGNSIYVGNQSGRLVSLDAENGARNWTLQQGTTGPAWPAGDSIFAITDTQQLIRVDAGSGEIIWAAPLPGFTRETGGRRVEIFAHYGPVLAGGRVVVVSNDGRLRSFSPESGALVGTVDIPDGATSPPAVAGNTLYVLSTTGDLHAFR
ncbi:MAG: PQQ-binding-like beta-propeller repeat protein [Pseudomonadota bacterium]